MFKKISLLILIACTSTAIFGMSSVDELKRQLDHIKSQMLVIKRAWNTARLRIKIAEKRAPALFPSIKAALDKVISNSEFNTKIDAIATEQADAITNYAAFASIKRTFDISEFFPNVTMNQFGKVLFSALVEKEYCLMLGRKLAAKMQEITMAITSIQSQPPQPSPM